MPLFVKESLIPAPVARVFAFHESPGALEKLIPPWERVEVVLRGTSLAPGTKVVLPGGTRLIDEVDYALPLGPLGALFGGALVRRKLEAMFVFRHQATLAACTAPAA